MRRLEKEESKKERKIIELLVTLSKNELHIIRGGDEQNTESDDKK